MHLIGYGSSRGGFGKKGDASFRDCCLTILTLAQEHSLRRPQPVRRRVNHGLSWISVAAPQPAAWHTGLAQSLAHLSVYCGNVFSTAGDGHSSRGVVRALAGVRWPRTCFTESAFREQGPTQTTLHSAWGPDVALSVGVGYLETRQVRVPLFEQDTGTEGITLTDETSRSST